MTSLSGPVTSRGEHGDVPIRAHLRPDQGTLSTRSHRALHAMRSRPPPLLTLWTAESQSIMERMPGLLVKHTASMYRMCFSQPSTHVPAPRPLTTSLHQASYCAERVFALHASLMDSPSERHSSCVSLRLPSSFPPCLEVAPEAEPSEESDDGDEAGGVELAPHPTTPAKTTRTAAVFIT